MEKVRDGGRVVRKALVLAYGVHESGYREVIALDVGEAETQAFWRSFLRSLVERGLSGVQLVVSDAHAGLKKAIAQVLGCPWQRCTVHFLREALGHVRRDQQGMVAALLRPLFNAEDGEQARELAGDALQRLGKPLPKVAALPEEAEEDLLAFYSFPADHRPKLRSTNPLERVNREIGRRTDVVGIFPNDRALLRLAASVVIEQNDEWLVAAATSRSTRSRRSSRSGATTKTKRRCSRSPRPEQPTIKPTSYTRSWDLTRTDRSFSQSTVRPPSGRDSRDMEIGASRITPDRRRWRPGSEQPGLWPTRIVLAGCVAALSMVVAAGALSAPAGGHPARPVEVSYASPAALDAALRRHPAFVVRRFAPLRVAEVVPLGAEARAYAAALRGEPGILSAAPSPVRTVAAEPALALGVVSTPAGGAYEWQYYVTNAHRVPARVVAAARTLTIAVIDTGADLHARDLAGKVAGSYDVVRGRTGVTDTSGHGTFVASLAGAAGANGIGMAGFGGEAGLLIVKVADTPVFRGADVAQGILYAIRRGARIINLSVTGRVPSLAERAAIRYAAARGVLLVAAAGDDALEGNPVMYPRRSCNRSARRGSAGSASLSGHPTRTVEERPSPVWAADPELSARDVATILKETASQHGVWTPELGFGVVDVAAAVEAAPKNA